MDSPSEDDQIRMASRLFVQREFKLIPFLLAQEEDRALDELRNERGDPVRHMAVLATISRLRESIHALAAQSNVKVNFG